MEKYINWFQHIELKDAPQVGDKAAYQGEMLKHLTTSNVLVPPGFVLNVDAFRLFLGQNTLKERISHQLENLNIKDVGALKASGQMIRQWLLESVLPSDIEVALEKAFSLLLRDSVLNKEADSREDSCVNPSPSTLSFVVRPSPVFQNSPDKLINRLHETHFGIRTPEQLMKAVKAIYASLYTDRAITFCNHQSIHFDQAEMAVSVQSFVHSDQACSGVISTQHCESGFDQAVFISSIFGVGERLLENRVNPDEHCVYKTGLIKKRPSIVRRSLGGKSKKLVLPPVERASYKLEVQDVPLVERQRFCLLDDEVASLAQSALAIEQHFGRAMRMEWAKDAQTEQMYILQAVPLDLFCRKVPTVLERYLLREKGSVLLEGRSVGHKISSGRVKIVDEFCLDAQIGAGDILVADLTDPDWEPLMKRAAGIITNRGGRTCHAAIIARELGIPAIVGCGDATEQLTEGQEVTITCAEGDTGLVYNGQLDFELKKNSVHSMPKVPVDIMMNVGNPDRAFDFQALPNEGVGLARLEFIINRMIGIHPKALLCYQHLSPEVQKSIQNRINGYASPVDFYVEKLVEGISTLGIAFASKRVIVRLSDFKSNEYANLIGGRLYEPTEENPMLGFRGAARYISEAFKDCFELECRAIKRARDEIGLKHIEILVPFVRTVGQAKQVVELLAENGLVRGQDGLKVMMMCELPSNALLAEQFLEHFDGFSIGSNDLAQLTLGLDRDSGIVAHLFDERNEAIKCLLKRAIEACKAAGKYVGICGQGPADHPEMAKWLVEQEVDSISLSPDSVLETWFALSDES